MRAVPVMMGIQSPTGSHIDRLSATIMDLPSGAVVVEHGAGLYSTPLLARADVRIQCIETHIGWAEWARWMYSESGRTFSIEDNWKRVDLSASVVFIDGDARSRGRLLKLCLDQSIPVVIAHDTEPEHWNEYGHQSHFFSHPRYAVESDAAPHRTTVWRLKS